MIIKRRKAKGDGLEDRSVSELREIAAKLGLDLPARANKADLIAAIRAA